MQSRFHHRAASASPIRVGRVSARAPGRLVLLVVLCALGIPGAASAQLVAPVHPWSSAVDHRLEDHAFHDESSDRDARGVDLTGGRLDGADFQRGQLDGATLVSLSARFADFSRASLTGADLSRGDLTGATFDSADLSLATLFDLRAGCADDPATPTPDLVCADFDFATLDGVDATCEVGGAACVPADRSDFSGASLQWASAVGARFDDALFKGGAATRTRLDGGDFSDASFVRVDFSREGTPAPTERFVSLSGARAVGADFSDANLAYAELRSLDAADLTNADSPANFSRTDLSNADLRLADLAGATITGTIFQGADLSGAFLDDVTDPCESDGTGCVDFTNAILSGAVLDGADLAGLSFANHPFLDAASFADALVTGTDFSGADLTDAILIRLVVDADCVANTSCPNFTGAIMDGVTMTGTDFEALGFVFQGLAGPSLAGANLGGSTIRSKTTAAGYDPDLSMLDLEGASFAAVTAYDTNFTNATLLTADLSDASLACADFTSADLRDADFDAATICDTNVCPGEDPVTGSRCASFDSAVVAADATFGGARFTNLTFPTDESLVSLGLPDLTGTDLDGASFDAVDLTNVVFVRATLRQASLVGALGLATATWTDADLTGAILHDVDLAGVVLRDAILDAVSLCDTSSGTSEQCTSLVGANLAGVPGALGARMRDVDFGVLADPADTSVPFDSDLKGADLSYTDLQGASFRLLDLDGTRFVGALLQGADFGLSGLDGADFSNARLDNATLSGALLPTGCTTTTPFDFAVLSGAVWRGARFDLTNCFDFLTVDPDLRFVDLSESTISTETPGATLAGIDLRRSTLRGVIMIHADATGTDFDSMDARCLATDSFCATFSSSDFSDANLRAADLRGVVLTDTTLTRSNFAQARLDGANLGGAHLDAADFTDARLNGAILTGADLPSGCTTVFDGASLGGVAWRDARFDLADCFDFAAIDPDLGSVDFTDAVVSTALVPAALAGLDLSGASLIGASLESADLTGTLLDGADLSGADLSSASFDATDLSNAILHDVDFSGADLRGSTLDAVSLCDTGDDGVTISQCAILSGAVLAGSFVTPGASMRGVDFGVLADPNDVEPPLVWQLTGADLRYTDLGGADFEALDLSGTQLVGALLDGANLIGASLAGARLTNAVLDGADLTNASLADALLVGARFAGTEFSAGGVNAEVVVGESELACTPAGGVSPVDLVGANLAAADLSAAEHFYPGCIVFDQTTLYSVATRFPPGFPEDPNMTLIPEPATALMQLAVLGTLWSLRRRRAA